MTEEPYPTQVPSRILCEELYPYYQVIKDKNSPLNLPFSYFKMYREMEEKRNQLKTILGEFNSLYQIITAEKEVVDNPEDYPKITVELARNRLTLAMDRARELNFV